MNLTEFLNVTGWQQKTSLDLTGREIRGAYCGDLLSWVMGKGKPGQAWITVQGHLNVIAVAELREFSCIVLADEAEPQEAFLAKADEEGIPVIASRIPAYETAKKMAELGI